MTTINGVGNSSFIRSPLDSAGQGLAGIEWPSTPGLGAAASTTFSGPADFFNKLTQLKDKNPDKFMEVVSTITEKLKSAASEHSADAGGKMLSDLAAKFEDVANGGDLVQLQPPEPPRFAPTDPQPPAQYAQQGQLSVTQWFQNTGRPLQGNYLEELFASFSSKVDQAS